jgi:UrcA family protein
LQRKITLIWSRDMNTSIFNTVLVALCLIAAAVGTAAQAQTPPVSAATAPAVPNTLKVSLAGLDLSTAEGVHAAQERVRLAARRVCAKVANSADMQRQLDYITCIDEAMAPVVAQIGEMARQASGQRLADAAK